MMFGDPTTPQTPTPAPTPQQIQAALADYKQRVAARHEARATGQADDNAMLDQKDDRPWYENAGRGLAAGLSSSGTSTMGMVGKLLTAGGADHVGPAITREANDLDFKNRDFYDPHGTAGRIGAGGGEMLGDAAQIMAPGGFIGDMGKAGGMVDGLANGGRLARLAATGIRALPGAAIHAGVQKITDDPFQSTQHSVLGTMGRDVGAVYGAELAGAPFAAVGRKLGLIGSKAAPAVEAAAEAAPAATAPAASFDPDAASPQIMKLREQVDALRQPFLEAQQNKDRQGAAGIAKRMAALRAQVEELREQGRAAIANGVPAPASTPIPPAAPQGGHPALSPEENAKFEEMKNIFKGPLDPSAPPRVPTPEDLAFEQKVKDAVAPPVPAAAPDDRADKFKKAMDDVRAGMSDQKRAKFDAAQAARKPATPVPPQSEEEKQAMADLKKLTDEKQARRAARQAAEAPAKAPDGPVEKVKAPKAKAAPPAGAKPSKGAQGSKTSKSAPATKPAASPSPAAPAKLSAKEIKDYAQHEDYVNSVGKMFDGLPEGAAKERVRAKIQESKDILKKLDAKRKGS